MHNDIVRELTYARHVPDVKKNLLFVGALEIKGYKVIIEAGVLKMYHGALMVLKEVRYPNLYYLQGRIVIGMIVVADDSSETTILWHMQLAHAGEISLTAL
ncbi:hypothetical protein KFK09_016921 [Dendrobium nobile]|uniref:GAG-pre-integrase domain-containing protein n=1 Tax=Dendrobium nobile TaxID=94219 RepID=A0A8T3AZJ4_DENNO|nr:hypothetical protein KFK09_016921 [Dendrobium nobile]